MNAIGIQTRKLEFVQHFLKLNKESAISKFEDLLREERLKQIEQELCKPMSLKQLNSIIDKAEEDDTNGRMTSAKKLLKTIDTWR